MHDKHKFNDDLLWFCGVRMEKGRCYPGWWRVSGTWRLCGCSAGVLEQSCWENRKTQTHRRTPAASPAPCLSSAGRKLKSRLALWALDPTQCTGLGWFLVAGIPARRRLMVASQRC